MTQVPVTEGQDPGGLPGFSSDRAGPSSERLFPGGDPLTMTRHVHPAPPAIFFSHLTREMASASFLGKAAFGWQGSHTGADSWPEVARFPVTSSTSKTLTPGPGQMLWKSMAEVGGAELLGLGL